jgi:hypothetical protein
MIIDLSRFGLRSSVGIDGKTAYHAPVCRGLGPKHNVNTLITFILDGKVEVILTHDTFELKAGQGDLYTFGIQDDLIMLDFAGECLG